MEQNEGHAAPEIVAQLDSEKYPHYFQWLPRDNEDTRTSTAPLIIFVHGAGGRLDQWTQQIQYFHKEGYNVFAFDMRGHGQSPKEDNWELYSPTTLLADMEALFDYAVRLHNLPDSRKYLVAHSYGSALALTYLAQPTASSVKFDAVALLGPAARVTSTSHPIFYLPVVALEWLRPLMADTFRTKSWHANTDPELIDAEGRIAATNPFIVMKPLFRQARWPAETEVRKVNLPVLLIAGESDGLTPKAEAEVLAGWIDGSRLEVVENAAHMMMMEQPDTVNRLLHDFFVRQSLTLSAEEEADLQRAIRQGCGGDGQE